MAKIGKVLEQLLKKAGIDTTAAEILPLLALEADMPDDQAAKLSTALLTVDAAKSNPELLKHFRATVLSPADSAMDAIITELGLQPGDDFVNNKNTYEKISILSKLIHAEGKKAKPGGEGDAAKWAAKEAQLQKELKELKDGFVQKENSWKEQQEATHVNTELKLFLSGQKYSLPEKMSMSAKLTTATNTVLEKLAADGFTLKRDAAGKLSIVNADGNPAYNAANEAIVPTTYFTAALADNALLAINDPNNPDPADPGKVTVDPKAGNAAITAEIDAQLKEFTS